MRNRPNPRKPKRPATLKGMERAQRRGGTEGLAEYLETHSVHEVWDKLAPTKG